jgi:hypothetical protein
VRLASGAFYFDIYLMTFYEIIKDCALKMRLENILVQKKAAILDRCFHLVMDTYPSDTSKFLKQEKDRFMNPVGHTISQEIKALYGELIKEMNSDKVYTSLDNIIRIRSVQDFSPSQAIAFIYLLKRAIREELEFEIRQQGILEELLKFESKIDEIVLFAFDIYMRCREKIYELRINEVKAEREKALRLLEIIHPTEQ